MSEGNRLCAMYYPDCRITNTSSLATFCLYFDEIHLVTPSDFARDPTNYLKGLPDRVQVGLIGETTPEALRQGEALADFYRFALINKPLMGKVIFYEPHLLCSQINRMIDKLHGEGLPADELLSFAMGETPEMKAFNSFCREHPEVGDELLLRIAPTSLFLAKENNWVLVGDRADMPFPVMSERLSEVKALSAVIAEECLRLVLPACLSTSPEEILDAREKLKNELTPFRMAMQKLTLALRSLLGENPSADHLRREARFLVESQVEPALLDLHRRVEQERGKLWRRLFGAAVGWIPMIGRAFTAPTPDLIYQAIQKASADIGSLLEGAQGITIAKELGLSFLLHAEQHMREKSRT